MTVSAGQRLREVADRLVVGASQLCLGAMVSLTLLDALGRNVGRPLPGASELVALLLGGTFFGGAALATREESHIRIGIVVDHWFRGRLLRAEAAVSRWIAAGGFATLAWMTYRDAFALQLRGVQTEFLGLPQSVAVYGLAALATAAALYLVIAPRSTNPGDDGRSSGVPR